MNRHIYVLIFATIFLTGLKSHALPAPVSSTVFDVNQNGLVSLLNRSEIQAAFEATLSSSREVMALGSLAKGTGAKSAATEISFILRTEEAPSRKISSN